MLTFLAPKIPGRTGDGVTRRDFLRIGSLGIGGLTLADVLRFKAQGAVRSQSSHKAVIMVYLPGGPSHIDMYDLKPNAPAEYRGEFSPIRTNVPGIDVCELLPRHARIADKFSIVRGIRTHGNHDPTELLTGIHAVASGQIGTVRRPAFGCVVSKLLGTEGPIPPYVSTSNHKLLGSYDDPEEPAYLGPTHRPFSAVGPIMQNLARPADITLERQEDRGALLRHFDSLQRDMDNPNRSFEGIDSYRRRALEMIVSTKVRDALDLNREPANLRALYGNAGADFLRARRLVEAGVSVVSIAARFYVNLGGGMNDPGGWDTHAYNFNLLRAKLPIYDQAVATLINDLATRGLDQDVAVVIWGEFGRQPRIGDVTPDGRGHWPSASCALIAGGGLQMGRIAGATDPRAERSVNRPYTAQHVLATLYDVLGIDPATTLQDFSGRPQFLLDRHEKITELI